MRSSKSRSRNKSNRQRTLGNIVNRVFDSSGPEGKVRGTPQQIIEKYLTLARDAQLSNDRVAEQSFFQHAEHYTRMLGEAQREQAERQGQQNGYGRDDDRDDAGHGDNGHSAQGHATQGHVAQGQQNSNNQRNDDRRDDNRAENRQDNRNENRNDNRPDNRNENRNENRPDNRNDNRNENRRDNRRDDRPNDRRDQNQNRDERQNDRREERQPRHDSPAEPVAEQGLPPVIAAEEQSGPVETPEAPRANPSVPAPQPPAAPQEQLKLEPEAEEAKTEKAPVRRRAPRSTAAAEGTTEAAPATPRPRRAKAAPTADTVSANDKTSGE